MTRLTAISLVLLAGLAHAGTVRGTVTLPVEGRAPETRDGHWRIENGVLPLGPRVPDPRTEVLVVLEGPSTIKKPDDKSPTVTVELHGLRLDPKVVVVPVGATVVFKNSDRVPHTLYLENALAVMKPEPTPAGQSRSTRLMATAEYVLRDQEYPHIEGTLVVVQSPLATQVDDKGGFKLDVPEGKYKLRVFWHGDWVLDQPLDVGPKTTDLSLQIPARSAKPAADKGRAE